MAELKTKVNAASVTDFLNTVEDEQKRKDSFALLKIFEEVTGEKPKMWGDSIVGFGQYHYKSERSKQEGDWPLTGFSPRKNALTLYAVSYEEGREKLLENLGKHTSSKGCIYIKKLSDVDEDVLRDVIKHCAEVIKKLYPSN
jgi:hypothetical protein